MADTDNNIKVAIRIRPQVPKEVIDMCTVCTDVTPNEPQVWLGKDKAFTFDHVFDLPSRQDQVYRSCCHQLVEGYVLSPSHRLHFSFSVSIFSLVVGDDESAKERKCVTELKENGFNFSSHCLLFCNR